MIRHETPSEQLERERLRADRAEEQLKRAMTVIRAAESYAEWEGQRREYFDLIKAWRKQHDPQEMA